MTPEALSSWQAPKRTTLSRRANKPRAPKRWLEEKHGAKSRRGWRKLHMALDADSGDIIAHVVTDQHAGDASQVEPLLKQIDLPIGRFTADGAYDGEPTYNAVTSHSADATVVIPPRANAVERPDSDPSRQRNRHIPAITPVAG